MTGIRAAACLTMLLAMTACGGDGDGDEGGGSASDQPDCESVWVEGELLPEDYDGCKEPEDVVADSKTTDCADGSTIATWDDRFYATLGEEVQAVEGDIASDAKYDTFTAACKG